MTTSSEEVIAIPDHAPHDRFLLPLTSRQLAPSIWRVRDLDPAVAGAAHSHGWTSLTLDLSVTVDKQSLLVELAKACEFPDYFGHNWDAAADCLQDLSWLASAPIVLFVRSGDNFKRSHQRLATVLVDVLVETIEHWVERGVVFQVLWDAAEEDTGPGLPLDEADDGIANYPVASATLGSVAAWPIPNI